MGERRTSTRKKSFLRGRVMYNNRQSAVECLIRDVSEHGANLIFSDTASIPEVVELYIPQKDQTFRAHVQWRSGDEVGVAFGDAPAAPAPAATWPGGSSGSKRRSPRSGACCDGSRPTSRPATSRKPRRA